MKTLSIRVRLGKRGYSIGVGAGLLDKAGTLIKRAGFGPQAVVITSGPVARLYLARLKRSLRRAGLDAVTIQVPDGERAKTLQTAERVWRALLRKRLERSAVVIALGGGTVGDLAGFIASTYLRGTPLIHVPTTLLADIDSAIGGKTGVNLPEGKNLVGTFYQPGMVISDVSLLKTLPARQLSVGLAEAVKYGVIWDARLFTFIEKNIVDLRRASTRPMMQLVERCSRIKAGIVARDERESGLRAILNYGHTIGHAIEASSGYSLTHGEAISIGMMGAGHLALGRGWIGRRVLERQERLLRAAGLPVRLQRRPISRIMHHLLFDKKRHRGRQCFILPRRIGKVVLTHHVTRKEVEQVLRGLRTR